MECSNCNTLNFRDHKYCRECGRPLPRTTAQPWEQTRMDGYMAVDGGQAQDVQVQKLLEQAFASFELGQVADARLACQSALALRGESSAAHSLLGLIYEKEGRKADAIREFQIVLQLNPDSAADRAHLDRLQNISRRRAPLLAGWAKNRKPLIAGIVTAGVVMIGGLWMAAGALKPAPARAARVVPSNLRMLRSAPGAVAPTAGSVRLPPPPVGRSQGPATWPMAANPAAGVPAAPSGFGGIPPTTQMNARMQGLAPRLFGQRTALPPRAQVPRIPSLAPAPVRVPNFAVVPRTSGERPSSVPTLPDPRAPQGEPAAPEATATPPIVPGGAPQSTPPTAPATREDQDEPAGGGSYIHIRPVGGEGSDGAATADTPGSSALRASAGIRPASPAQPGAAPAGPSLAEARLHQQNGLNLWRSRDFAAAYQEYEFAAQLYRLIASRGGSEAAAAQEGLRAAEQGMRASSGGR
jgi:tetratricopeptide (TPR) repeat protein